MPSITIPNPYTFYIQNNVTVYAEVSIILANSTIPMVGEVFKNGDGNFNWPTCSCGYQMSQKDVYSSLLKCGNPYCTERLKRMSSYIQSLNNINNLDLNKFLVIDRVKWEATGINIQELLELVKSDDVMGYYQYLKSFLKTDLQIRNLDLVWQSSYKVLRESYEKFIRG